METENTEIVRWRCPRLYTEINVVLGRYTLVIKLSIIIMNFENLVVVITTFLMRAYILQYCGPKITNAYLLSLKRQTQ